MPCGYGKSNPFCENQAIKNCNVCSWLQSSYSFHSWLQVLLLHADTREVRRSKKTFLILATYTGKWRAGKKRSSWKVIIPSLIHDALFHIILLTQLHCASKYPAVDRLIASASWGQNYIYTDNHPWAPGHTVNNLLVGWRGSRVDHSRVPLPRTVSLWLLDISAWFFWSCFSLNTWNNRKVVMQSVSTEWCVHSMLLREWRIWHQNIWCVLKYTVHWETVEDCVGQKKPNPA